MVKLQDPKVWLDAATQVFYSLGVGFGSLIAFASYNPPTSNCHRDGITVALINAGTSMLACVVVFSILGFKAMNLHQVCLSELVFAVFNSKLIYNKCDKLIMLLSTVFKRRLHFYLKIPALIIPKCQ